MSFFAFQGPENYPSSHFRGFLTYLYWICHTLLISPTIQVEAFFSMCLYGRRLRFSWHHGMSYHMAHVSSPNNVSIHIQRYLLETQGIKTTMSMLFWLLLEIPSLKTVSVVLHDQPPYKGITTQGIFLQLIISIYHKQLALIKIHQHQLAFISTDQHLVIFLIHNFSPDQHLSAFINIHQHSSAISYDKLRRTSA